MQGVTGRGKVRVKHLVVTLTIGKVLQGHIQEFERGVPSGNFPGVLGWNLYTKGEGGGTLWSCPCFFLLLFLSVYLLLFFLGGGGVTDWF